MARFIDADELKEAIVSQYGPQATPDGIMRSGVLNALHLIETAPTVDAEPVRHGKWMARKRNENEPSEAIDCCSCCMYPISHVWQGDYKYCPNCGAKMKEKKEEK